MLKYLDYIKSVLSQIEEKDISDALINEVNIYIKYWKKYFTDSSRSPLYHSLPSLYDMHNFHLPTGESVSISWDINSLYNVAQKAPINHATLSEFEELLYDDLTASLDEFLRISRKVKSIHKHKYQPALVIYFKPMHTAILLDGRHRYMEFKKFKPSELIPFYYLDDEMCVTSILGKKDLVTYIILHNIEVINNFIVGQETLERIINIENCMGG